MHNFQCFLEGRTQTGWLPMNISNEVMNIISVGFRRVLLWVDWRGWGGQEVHRLYSMEGKTYPLLYWTVLF